MECILRRLMFPISSLEAIFILTPDLHVLQAREEEVKEEGQDSDEVNHVHQPKFGI